MGLPGFPACLERFGLCPAQFPAGHANAWPMSKRPTITIKPREGRKARAGAPWIFSNEIVMDAAAKAVPPGSLVHVKYDDGQDVGTGYFNSKSLIAVRLLARETGAPVDAAFFAGRLKRALGLRDMLYARPFYR